MKPRMQMGKLCFATKLRHLILADFAHDDDTLLLLEMVNIGMPRSNDWWLTLSLDASVCVCERFLTPCTLFRNPFQRPTHQQRAGSTL